MKDKQPPFLTVVGESETEEQQEEQIEDELLAHAEMLKGLHDEVELNVTDVTSLIRVDLGDGRKNVFLVTKNDSEDLYTMLGVAQSSVLDIMKGVGVA